MTTPTPDLASMPMREWSLIPGSVGSLTVRPMTAGEGGPVDHYILTTPTREFPVWSAYSVGDRLHVVSPVEPPMGRWVELGGIIHTTLFSADAARRWLIGQDRDGGLQL